MKIKSLAFIVAIICSNIILCSAQPNESLSLKVGAAKVDITPGKDALTSEFNKIRDNLYTRAIVVDNGLTSAALISIDNGMLNENIWRDVTKRINTETGIPVENIFISPSHSHSSPMLSPPQNPNQETGLDPIISNYITIIEDAMVNATLEAKSKLQPAKIGFGTGTSYLNVNRDVLDPETRLWSQGPNYDGPSDKTVAIIKFESLSGNLIATYINYAMHANWMYMTGAISSGLPGGVCGYIENYYKNFYNTDVVALWSMGAAGDQNPVYFGSVPREVSSNNPDAAYERLSQMINSVGQILGEEVLRVLQQTIRLDDSIAIYGSQEIISCPGRIRTDTNNREGKPGSYIDGDPVDIRLSLLMLGDIALTATNGDCFNIISQRLKEQSPYANTLMTSHTNGGGAGYIPSDDAFARYTFQVLSSQLQPGHAETMIINSLLDMMKQAQ